jgi:DNA modification methylase
LNGDAKVKEFFPANFKLEESTVWRFGSRGKWAVHNHIYPGNWAPEVPRNLILRYSNPGSTVLDPCVGGGTSMIECLLRGRNGVGVDINPRAVSITELRLNNLRKAAKKQGYTLPDVMIKVRRGDARNLDFIPNQSIDLICAHPAYMDVIKYTASCFEDFSRISDPDEYFDSIRKMTKEFQRVLKQNGHVGIMIGDVRKEKQIIPLGLRLERIFEEEKFKLHEIFIKEQERCSSNEFYWNHEVIFRIAHEYIFVFGKD